MMNIIDGIKNKLKCAVVIVCIVLFVFGILFALSVINASESWPAYNVCCEKTKNNAWCQNTLQSNCDPSIDLKTGNVFLSTPTSCDATSFCKPGCCIDTSEGLCMENTPQRVCDENSGTWANDAKCNVPQCSLGCCLLGDQASFVTLTRCKKLSSFYGLETNFKKNVKDEASCIMLAYMQDKGACVYEVENMKTCKFTTRDECLNTNKTRGSNMTSAPMFFINYLCSADELGTNCGPTTRTMCVPGNDEVYFMDTCGNPANIYDSSQINNPAYWKKIVKKSDSCNYNDAKGNIISKTCGNCDYFKGSLCGKGSASYGDYICKDLNCYDTENGKDYKNGESWCVDQGPTGEGRDLVGSRHFRHICINGEEITEACEDFRNEICIENMITTYGGNFIESACRPNRWKDCLEQTEKDDCLNTDKRDCFWLKGAHFNKAGTTAAGVDSSGGYVCLPNFSPGLKFWSDGDAKSICSLGSVKETVVFEKNVFGSLECSENCDVLKNDWAVKMNNICTSLGDCGGYSNFIGEFTSKGAEWKVNGKKKVIQGLMERMKAKASE